jgi:tetratricopeptide (TPR) repeat protein
VEGGSPTEVAARIRRRAGTAVQWAAALDDWALVVRDCGLRDPNRDPAGWKRLLEVAGAVDPDPWRAELRRRMRREDLNALRKQAAEAAEADIGALPVQSLQLMGSALAIGGDLPACAAWHRRAHRQHPGDALLAFELAFHLSELPSADWTEVLRFSEAALAARQSPGMYRWVGISLSRLGRHDEAAAVFRKAIELMPDSAGLHADLGRALAAQGKRDEAIAEYREGIRLDGSTHGVAINSLADMLRAGGDPDVAVAVYLQIIRIDPWSDRAHFNLVDALRAKGGVDRALAACKEALRLDPDRAPYHSALGTLLLNQGDFDGAAAEYARADPLAGPLNVVAIAYACLFLIRGDSEGYDGICQHMVRRAGETKDSHEALVLARICAVGHKTPVEPARVIRWANQATVSRHPWTFHVLGLAQYRAGQFDQALRSFDEADARPWHARELNWFGRALAHHRLGDSDEARRCLDKGIQWLEREGTSPGQPSTLTLTPEDWLEGLLLRREAEALLAEAPAKTKD